MKEKKITLNFISSHLSELDIKDQELIANAKWYKLMMKELPF